MKTIDLKSLSVGVCATLIFFALTSGKVSDEDNNIEVVPASPQLGLFNKQTKKLYIYNFSAVGKISEEPRYTYQVSSDGSSISSN
jgi:hypothetical protein